LAAYGGTGHLHDSPARKFSATLLTWFNPMNEFLVEIYIEQVTEYIALGCSNAIAYYRGGKSYLLK